MATKESIQNAYIDYVLTVGEQPKSVYIFAKQNEMAEEEFYNFFGSFNAIEQSIWTDMAAKTIAEIQTQEVWSGYTSREKALSFFYSFFEFAKSKRSFATYSANKINRGFATPTVWQGLKNEFEIFSTGILQDGIESGELTDRKFLPISIKMHYGYNLYLYSTSGPMTCLPVLKKPTKLLRKG